jgi:GNAT superfamily N-acetyltransferase
MTVSADGLHIREYAETDRQDLEACFAEYQEHNRALEAGRRPGEEVASRYAEHLLGECAACDGRVFVADAGGKVVGFVGVWTEKPANGFIDEIPSFARLGNIFVLDEYRGRAIGGALFRRAELFAAEKGHKRLMLAVLSANADARKMCEGYGMREHEAVYVKEL